MNTATRLIALLALVLVWAPRLLAAQPGAKPNILIILTDDQGRGDYSAFGTKDIQTPAMDSLFAHGLTFNNFYANSCVCSPTRAALLTGCHPDRVGVPGVIRDESPADSWGYLSPSATLLPKLLKPAGYHTAIIGKWHLGLASPNIPNDRGFDYFHGFLGDMMDDYYTHRRNGHNFMRENRTVVDPKGHATDLFTDWACAYLTDRAKTPDQPFFLYLAYNAPHDPIQPPPDWLEKVRKAHPEMSARRARLVALIEHLDSGIGRILQTLDQTKLADNTLVIFTSDNGGVLRNEANVGPWRGDKGHVYEGGLRVPGAARWPGHIIPGTSTDRITLTMDLFPTALEAAGVTPPAGIDGRSCLPTLLGRSEPEVPRQYYFVRREGNMNYQGKTINAVRVGDWKLLQDSPFAPLELYNLKDDPRETNNLAKKDRRTFNALSAAFRHQIQRAGAVPWQASEK